MFSQTLYHKTQVHAKSSHIIHAEISLNLLFLNSAFPQNPYTFTFEFSDPYKFYGR